VPKERFGPLMASLLLSLLTPMMSAAMRPAASRASSDSTKPLSCTTPFSTSTLTSLALTSLLSIRFVFTWAASVASS